MFIMKIMDWIIYSQSTRSAYNHKLKTVVFLFLTDSTAMLLIPTGSKLQLTSFCPDDKAVNIMWAILMILWYMFNLKPNVTVQVVLPEYKLLHWYCFFSLDSPVLCGCHIYRVLLDVWHLKHPPVKRKAILFHCMFYYYSFQLIRLPTVNVSAVF